MEQRYILSAIDAALQAGADILSIYNDPASDFKIERKADNSPLSVSALSNNSFKSSFMRLFYFKINTLSTMGTSERKTVFLTYNFIF